MTVAAPIWPKTLRPAVRYTTCWRCGITKPRPEVHQKACHDCAWVIRYEQDLWKKDDEAA